MLKRFLPPVPVAIDAACDGAALAALFCAPALAGRRAALIIDDAAVRLWQVTPPANLASLDELRFQSLYGDSPDGWQLAAAWDARAPFMAAALPAGLLADVLDAAGAARVSVSSITPRFLAAWNRHCRRLAPDTWLAQVHGGVLRLGAGHGARLAAVRSCTIPPGAGPDWLDTHLVREAARLDRALPARLALCGQAPHGWTGGAGKVPVDLLTDRSAP